MFEDADVVGGKRCLGVDDGSSNRVGLGLSSVVFEAGSGKNVLTGGVGIHK